MAYAKLRSGGIVVCPTIRVWDISMNLIGQLADEPTETADGTRTATLPLDDEVAAWILADSRRGAHLTIDIPGGNQWLGRLHHWSIDRVGPCKYCTHCLAKQLTVVWSAS